MSKPAILNLRSLAEYPLPRVDDDADKDQRGQVLVVGGSPRVPGAAMLTGLAALRAGAGKLMLAVPRSMSVATGLAVPECGVIALPETAQGESRTSSDLKRTIARAAAIVVGPGLVSPRPAKKLTESLLELPRKGTLILDAAALAALRPRTKARRGPPLVITPHHGEMATLLDVPISQIERQPLPSARKAAATYGAIVILKSKVTYVVTPTGSAWEHDGGLPGIATSGSGDVLAGLIAGLAARCSDPLAACLWAVVTHARAGKILARKIGPLGFLARELLLEIPKLLKA